MIRMRKSCWKIIPVLSLLALGVAATIIVFWVIDPKISALSAGYEKKQREYLKELEQIQRWED